jgi:bifunctional DNA-binding transcriptional regulator/antitoxin component of YhaV-PrlF toxin-antitoxin module
VKKLKMTTKRQVTFPVEVCEALGLGPGDEVFLDVQECQGGRVWILRPAQSPDRSWMHALRRYAVGREHSLKAIRESIAARRPRRPPPGGGRP